MIIIKLKNKIIMIYYNQINLNKFAIVILLIYQNVGYKLIELSKLFEYSRFSEKT